MEERQIVIEYIDGVTKRISKKKAFEELDNIMSSKLLVIEPVIEQDWEKAIKYFSL